MSDITPRNCDACSAFSSIIAAYAWASSDQSGDLFFADTSVSGGKFCVEWASLLRGVHTLLKAAGEWMTVGSMKSIVQPRQIDPELAESVDLEASAKLTALSQLWESSLGDFDSGDVETLNETLDLLKEASGLVALRSVDLGGVLLAC